MCIRDRDFLTLTTTCCQIDLEKLFEGGFSTGHGFLREPNSIHSYSALACIAIQSNQNDQHGGQSIPNFDYAMAGGVRKSYLHAYKANMAKAIELLTGREDAKDFTCLLYTSLLSKSRITGRSPPKWRPAERRSDPAWR